MTPPRQSKEKNKMLDVIFETAIALARNEVKRFGPAALTSVEKALTLPTKTLDRLTKGMKPEEKSEARRLTIRAADAMSDALVYLVSKGAITADE
jgi:hypothetical protein